MKKLLLFGVALAIAPIGLNAQCTTSNATGCICEDGTQDCELLPDIMVSWDAVENYLNGPTEYSQTGNGVNNGRLRITASTPNNGHGSFTVRGSDYFVCGSDTVLGDPGVCNDGSAPRQLIVQRIYHKNSDGTMTYTDEWAGAMTYHPTHGHNHVDDWGVFTLRMEDVNEPNPLNWPIVGEGAKLGFCLMDYGTCSDYPGHCRDENRYYQQGSTMLNGDFINYGLGGGQYNCSPIEQGISVGHTDIYSENLDGMWINIPPGTCNGDYYIVCDVDPRNNFREEDETNNWTAVPVTLVNQDAPGNPVATITSSAQSVLCDGENITLTANAGSDFVWSTGDSTQSIVISSAGTYSVTVTNYCGTATSVPFVVTTNTSPAAPGLTSDADTVCAGQTATLTATGSNVTWFDNNGFQVGTGNTYTTPSLMSTSTYFAHDANIDPGAVTNVGLVDNSGGGGNFNSDQWLIFDTYKPVKINSVKVYAQGDGDRTIQVLDQGGNLIQQGTFFIADGEQRVDLNFNVPIGNNFEFRVNGTKNLYRNNQGVNFPYERQDTLSITGTSSGNSYYYFFYDWEVTVGSSECIGPDASITVDVEVCSGLDDIALSEQMSVYPNPNNGQFTFDFEVPGTTDFDLSVVDMMGKVVYTRELKQITGKYTQPIDLGSVAKGIYFVKVDVEGASYFHKLIVH